MSDRCCPHPNGAAKDFAREFDIWLEEAEKDPEANDEGIAYAAERHSIIILRPEWGEENVNDMLDRIAIAIRAGREVLEVAAASKTNTLFVRMEGE